MLEDGQGAVGAGLQSRKCPAVDHPTSSEPLASAGPGCSNFENESGSPKRNR